MPGNPLEIQQSLTFPFPMLGTCRVCGGKVSSAATTCPHCGQQNPYPVALEPGALVQGTILQKLDFGIVVALPGGCTGLVHISEMSNGRIDRVPESLKLGQLIGLRVLTIASATNIRLRCDPAL